MAGPVLLIGGMWGYPGGPIREEMFCLVSMYMFPVAATTRAVRFTCTHTQTHTVCLTCVDVLVVLPVLATLRMHRSVLRRPRRRLMLDLRLRVGRALRGDDPRGCEELVDGGAQVGHLGGVQGPVVELGLPHALLQTCGHGSGDG